MAKDDELIPKYTSIVVRRVPKLTSETQKRKITTSEDLPWRENQRAQINMNDVGFQKHVNLADSDLPEEEKIKIMMERSSETYSEKNFAVKAKPYGVPPAAYICHKCGLPGHWIHNCPGVRDKSGKMMDIKSVKRPTGIPQDFLLEVEAGTPGAYLGKSGKYMVPIKDAEAYAQGKKDKRPFSVEENPPYFPSERIPPKQFICPLCDGLFREAVLVSCCGTTYCNECIMGHVFDAQVLGSHKCPNCEAILNDHESSVFENALVRSMIRDWLANEAVPSGVNVDAVQEACLKTFVNNRRVLKPKQAIGSSTNAHRKSSDSASEVGTKTDVRTTCSPSSFDEMISTLPCTLVTTSNDFMPVSSGTCIDSSINSENVIKLAVTDKHTPVVSSNTCAAVVASAPCATSMGSGRRPLLASTAGLPSSQISCISNCNSPTIIPTILPGINGTSNPLLSALYNIRVDNVQLPVPTPQVVLPVSLTSSLVGGSEWTVGGTLTATGSRSGLVDQIFHVNTSQTTFGLVPGSTLPGSLPTTVHPSNQALDGHKVLSKEEFYRLKMEMLHSTRRRHRHRSRSRSPVRSYRRDEPELSFRRHERSGRDHRVQRPSPDDEMDLGHRRRYDPDHSHKSKYDQFRTSHSHHHSGDTECLDVKTERQYFQQKRFVRGQPSRPRKSPPQPRERFYRYSCRSQSVSPRLQKPRECIRHHRQSPSDQCDSENYSSLDQVTSPMTVSVVPQYDLSEPESPGDCKGRHDSSRSNFHHIQPRSPDDGSSFIEERVNVLLSGEADRNCTNDVTGGEVKRQRKTKKHKKHKHRSEKKKSKKKSNLEAYNEASDIWVSSGADVTLRSSLSLDGLEKKMKKHKKHKREEKERKKKDRKHISTESDPFMQM
ncbi:Retinoblastoma-binding protein 6 [Paragonimus heterotremus]|uniref:Retinoblastoma-binding protein 6 n=1 Tax=Paragonimus heterotremus TaxID=100268 RepID=A0A8J4SK12_9TREM|nr:Retinoblastoma-binding protein 6 [Paragonimus heterotremus]